ncbi:MAG: efflux RND transporter periplasmic adaptor subunit [Gemmataceae bacterium]
MIPVAHRRPQRFSQRFSVSIIMLLTVGVTILLAHEGHAPLPTKGVQVDYARGHMLLTPAARDALAVTTAEVDIRSAENLLLAYANVELPWTHHGFATSRLPGRIVKVHVVPGQTVQAGDIVAEVKSLDLETLQLNAITAQTEIDLYEKILTELRASVESGSIAAQSLIDAESKRAQGQSSLIIAKNKWLALGLEQGAFDKLIKQGKPDPAMTLPVRVPVGGTVIHADLTAGKVIEPTEHLVEVADLSSVWVRLGVLEKDLPQVKVGTKVSIRLKALPGELFQTKVSAVAPYLDPITHLGSVWAELKNPSAVRPRVVPGMTGRAEIVQPAEKPRPSVPVSAVVREGADRFVLVEEANAASGSEYRKKTVAMGRRNGNQVEILAGELFPGDRVVVRGAHELGGLFAPNVLRLDPVAERSIGLRVERATAGSIDETVSLEGVVDLPPADRGSAAAQLSGAIANLRVDRGQQVKTGDILAEIISPELLALQLDLLRTSLEFDFETITLNRIKNLPVVAQRRVWETQARVTLLKDQVETLRRKLEMVGVSVADIDRVVTDRQVLSAVPIRSPISGEVVTFEKALGQAVAAREVLFTVHNRSRPLVMAAVSERDLSRVHVDNPVRVRFITDPDTLIQGRIIRSGRYVGADSRSLAVWVELSGKDPHRRIHGQLANVTVVTASHPVAICVPRGAVAGEAGSEVVFVRRTDGVFERRAVVVGKSDDRMMEIVQGLHAGENVAVAGVPELVTGFASLR